MRIATVTVLVLAACSPRAPLFSGEPAPVRIPAATLNGAHLKIVYSFVYDDPNVSLKGEAVARTASPDSVRLDFFVNNETVGDAVVIGDSLVVARPDVTRRIVPAMPFVWAALGVFRVPAGSDTAARVDADTLRVEIAGHDTWRAAFLGPELVRLDQISGGRIPQSASRVPGSVVHYRSTHPRRELELTVKQVDTLPPFECIDLALAPC